MINWKNQELKQLAVFISGTGSTLDNICRHCYEDNGLLKNIAQVTLVISNKVKVKGIEIAKQYGAIPVIIPYNQTMESREDWRERINKNIPSDIDLIVLAGFDQLVKVSHIKTVNVHPSLLPKFGGKGMYGSRVHQAVLAAGEKITGCTVHFANDEYDQGEIIARKIVTIDKEDNIESLTEKVKQAEREIYPQAIRNLLISNDLLK